MQGLERLNQTEPLRYIKQVGKNLWAIRGAKKGL